jgi:hypothetical protein
MGAALDLALEVFDAQLQRVPPYGLTLFGQRKNNELFPIDLLQLISLIRNSRIPIL